MPVFDQLERASFDGTQFLVRSCEITGNLRWSSHQYRHVSGHDPEKVGRNPYTVKMEAVFVTGNRDYPDLWPGRLNTIRNLFEFQETKDLVIPTIGHIDAFISEYNQKTDFKIRNGEEVSLTFVEDQMIDLIIGSQIITNPSSLTSAASNFEIQADTIEPKPSIFESIVDSVNAVFAIKDQFDIFGGLLASQLARLLEFIDEANRIVVELQDPVNYQVLEAMKDIADAAIQLSKDLSDTGRQPLLFVCPGVMSVAQISASLYSNTERSAEIMLNNPLDDPFQVQAGTEIIYFSEPV